MPSPFPGMDPWLEDPGLWPDVHTTLIVGLREALVPALRPRYVVRVEERVYLDDDPGGVLVPDLAVRGAPPMAPSSSSAHGASVAPVVLPTVMDVEVRERLLTIRAADSDEVVTVIEVLSPSNKRGPESEGRRQYLARRGHVLHSTAHLVELDLLRGGHRVPMLRPLPAAEYYAIVGRADRRPQCEVWPVGLRDRLPTIPIPLRAEEQVALDLQGVLDVAYDRAGWADAVNRAPDPTPPLREDDLAWARACLAAHRG
jgi:hypothetical protein